MSAKLQVKCWVGTKLLLAGLGSLGAVLGTGLHTAVHTLGVQAAADDVVTNAGQVLNTAAADHDHRVLLQVVAHTGDISGDFVTVGQAHTGDLTQSGVRLLRGRSTDGGADASLLGGGQVGLLVLQSVQALLHSGRIGKDEFIIHRFFVLFLGDEIV